MFSTVCDKSRKAQVLKALKGKVVKKMLFDEI